MAVYYNEFDKEKAETLRELIKEGVIADGDVDERSIVDVRPGDLDGYDQCHFFAGYGIWSYALRLAGWPDNRECWTGSCPCQPFSDAGRNQAFDDERHLWPDWFLLIEARRPLVCFGEQVASLDGLAWLDAVYSDLDDADYSCGALDLCAAGLGAPHRRQRLYWVADTGRGGGRRREEHAQAERRDQLCDSGNAGLMADTGGPELETRVRRMVYQPGKDGTPCAAAEPDGAVGGLADAGWQGRGQRNKSGEAAGALRLCAQALRDPGPCNGFWRGSNWVLTRPARVGDPPSLRPVEAGTFPLAHGAPARLGRLRGYGDGIVAQVAAAFIEAYMRLNRQ